jgi:hypothetical protein
LRSTVLMSTSDQLTAMMSFRSLLHILATDCQDLFHIKITAGDCGTVFYL